MENYKNTDMKNGDEMTKEQLLYPIGSYFGKLSLNSLLFNANLQCFAQKVSYIVGLHSNGKLSSQEAYQRLGELWRQLEQSEKTINSDS